jgi:hypothetical protein
MSGWQFTREANGWRWHRIAQGIVLESTSSPSFRSLLECLNDATSHGYSLVAPAQNLTAPLFKLL